MEIEEQQLAKAPSWHFFAHGSEIGIRGIGTTLPEAFEQISYGLINVITDTHHIQATEKHHFICNAPDFELLLINWLNDLIYAINNRKLLFKHFSAQLSLHTLEVEAYGEPVNLIKHRIEIFPKEVTFNHLKVLEFPGKWLTQCVVNLRESQKI